jgi:nitroimidazol reductase NimA-like FMN-containing flavoprotein (pyridoxamine 5'-phosphate oxidase superfamily)
MMGELNASQIDEVLRSEVVGRIGCIAQGWPYIVPVTYVYDGEHVYAHSSEGMKLRAMRADPLVCFQVDQIRSMHDWRSVLVRGHFEELRTEDAHRALNLLAARFARPKKEGANGDSRDWAPHESEALMPILYRIRIVDRTGRFQKT